VQVKVLVQQGQWHGGNADVFAVRGLHGQVLDLLDGALIH